MWTRFHDMHSDGTFKDGESRFHKPSPDDVAAAVETARTIVAEVRRTERPEPPNG